MMILTISIASRQYAASCPMADEIPYRLLESSKRIGPPSVTNYSIFVEIIPDVQQMEKLICQVLRNENADSSRIITVSIFYKLDKLFVIAGSPELERKLFSYHIAGYLWNAGLPNVQKRLWFYKDIHGNSLNAAKPYEFDHTKACSQLDSP